MKFVLYYILHFLSLMVELKQRAELFARNLDAEENDEQRLPYIRFRLGEAEEYGILYRYAEEILPLNAVTHVPYTTTHLRCYQPAGANADSAGSETFL